MTLRLPFESPELSYCACLIMQRKTGEVIHRQCRSKQLADSSPLNLPLVYWAIAANGKSSRLLAMDHATAEKAEKALFELEDR